jgi:hypothetical protein
VDVGGAERRAGEGAGAPRAVEARLICGEYPRSPAPLRRERGAASPLAVATNAIRELLHPYAGAPRVVEACLICGE